MNFLIQTSLFSTTLVQRYRNILSIFRTNLQLPDTVSESSSPSDRKSSIMTERVWGTWVFCGPLLI